MTTERLSENPFMRESLNASRFGKALLKDKIKGTRSSSPWKTSFEEVKIKEVRKLLNLEKDRKNFVFEATDFSLWKSFEGLFKGDKKVKDVEILTGHEILLGKHIFVSYYLCAFSLFLPVYMCLSLLLCVWAHICHASPVQELMTIICY